MKTCAKCEAEKPMEAFSRDRRSKDGRQGRCKACNRDYYQANRESKKARSRANHRLNRDRNNARSREYAKANRDRINAWYRSYQKNRVAQDPAYAAVRLLRKRLWSALNGKAKPASTMELVGCSTEKLCAWLEMHFDEGMTWENRGEWHIDHIRPIASFEDPADPRCWHWSNLQPLWAEDNIRKGDRY